MGTVLRGGSRRPAIALMYHALRGDTLPDGQDPHYTLETDAFERQIRDIAAGPGGCSAARLLAGQDDDAVIAVTFDDGHASNYTHALPILLQHGISADFFINPGTVGTPGFLGWAQLRDMAAAGMSIQSHGYDHVYLTRLDGHRLRSSLLAARNTIEQALGTPVTLLAPPGGRMPPNLIDIARECGYAHILSSRPGTIPAEHRRFRAIPRMAITAATSPATFASWISRSTPAIARERLRYESLALAKRLLGDDGYERVRSHALALLRRSA